MESETQPLLSPTYPSITDGPSENRRIWSRVCDPRSSIHRFILLIFMCFLGFGSYFCYDNPGALQKEMEHDMHINTAQFTSLYAWYSYPNFVLSFFGGILIDKVLGIRMGAIVFSLFILAGQLVFALGAVINTFWVMVFGRFIFGIGGESLAVAQNTYAVSWFKGKELNMVFGLQLSFARVGSTVNFNVMEPIYNAVLKMHTGYVCLGITLFIAASTCVLSQVCATVLGYFDWRAEKIMNKEAGKTGEVFRLKDIRYFPASFWFLSVICVTYYVAIFPFVGIGTVFFLRKFELEPYLANLTDSIMYIISAAASPFMGLLVDKIGYNLLWVFVATVITLACHILLAFSFLHPLVAMVFMGIGYSLLACSLWPMVSLVIPEHQLGTAYGLMQSVQNLGLGVIAMVAGYIVDSKGYFILGIFFQAWICIAITTCVILFVVDLRNDGILNMSTLKRKIYLESKKTSEVLEREQLLASSGSASGITPQDLLPNS